MDHARVGLGEQLDLALVDVDAVGDEVLGLEQPLCGILERADAVFVDDRLDLVYRLVRVKVDRDAGLAGLGTNSSRYASLTVVSEWGWNVVLIRPSALPSSFRAISRLSSMSARAPRRLSRR